MGYSTILHKRLERIREELDAYIKQKYCRKASNAIQILSDREFPKKKQEASATPGSASPGNISEKFLAYMKLCDDEFTDADYMDEEEPWQSEAEEAEKAQEAQEAAEAAEEAAKDKRAIKPLPSQAIDKILEQKEESFSRRLLRIIDEKGLKDSEVYKRANIDRRLFSKIRGDEAYTPSKKTAIAFCFALQLETGEAKKLLETAGYTLSASSRFDLIIMYLMEHKEYNIHFVNIVLDDYGEGTLSR